MKDDNFHKKGFTLVELAIVLVIIGLVIGGILVGQSLIDSARLNKLGREVAQYKIAVDLFEERFRCLPGDCVKAAGLGLGASGNGDGVLIFAESRYFWQHIVSGGILDVEYRSGPNRNMVETSLYPVTKFPEGGIISAGGNTLSNNYDIHLILCSPEADGDSATGCAGHSRGPLDVIDLIALDSKFDDGLPLSGDIKVIPASAQKNTYCTIGVTNVYDSSQPEFTNDPNVCTWDCPESYCQTSPYFKIRD